MARDFAPRVLGLWMGLAWSGSAWATPVLYTGGTQDDAVDRVAWNAQVPADELEPVDLSTLVERGPAKLLGTGIWKPCIEPSTADLETLLAQARKAWMYARIEQGELSLHKLSHVVACGPEALPNGLVYEAFFLQGVLRAVAGDAEAAHDSFYRAAMLDPNRGWDDNFAPAHGQAIFDAARAQVGQGARATLHLLPSGDQNLVDGTPALPTVVLAPGPHLLRTPTSQGWIVLDAGASATWYEPDSIPEDAAAWAEDRPQDLAWLLAVTRGAQEPVYVTTPRGVWAGDPAAGRFTALTMLPQPRPALARRGLMGAGGLVLAGGVGAAVYFAGVANDLSAECKDAVTDVSVCQANQEAHGTARRMSYVGDGAAVLGALLVTSGLALELQAGRRARVLLTTNGVGLQATVSSADPE